MDGDVGEVVSEYDLSVGIDFDELPNSETSDSTGCDFKAPDSSKEAKCSLAPYFFTSIWIFFLFLGHHSILDFRFWILD